MYPHPTPHDPVVLDEIAHDMAQESMDVNEMEAFELDQIELALYEDASTIGLTQDSIVDEIKDSLEAGDIRGLICANSDEELMRNARELQDYWRNKARRLV